MLSAIFPTLESKKNIQVPQMSDKDAEQRAVSMMALLKTDEDRLIQEAQTMYKENRADARRVFSAHVHGWTLLHACALRGCRKVIKIALKSGVDVNLRMGEPEGIPGGCSALHLAAHRGDVSVIDILLSNNVNVNQSDNSGKTPIYYAGRANNTLAAKTLRRAGALESSHGDEKQFSSVNLDDSHNAFCFLPFPGCSGTKSKR